MLILLPFLSIWACLQIWWAFMVHWPAVKPKTVTVPAWVLLLLALLAWIGSGWHLLMIMALVPAWYRLDMDAYMPADLRPSGLDIKKTKSINRRAILWILMGNLVAILLKIALCPNVHFSHT